MTAAPHSANLKGRMPLMAMALVITVFLSLFLNYYSPAFYGLTDEHAYLESAKTLAENHTLARNRESLLEFAGENFVAARPLSDTPFKTLYAKHPPATAAIFALAYMIAGPDGPFWVNGIFCMLAIVGAYLLGRDLVNPFVGVLAAGAIAISPLTLLFAVHPMSHAGELAAGVFICWVLLRVQKWPRIWIFACLGVLLGVAISIRYTNVFLLLPVAAGLIAPLRKLNWRQRFGTAGAMLFAIIMMLIPTLAFNAAAFGSPLNTGYTFTNESRAFSFYALRYHVAPISEAFVLTPWGLPLFYVLFIPAIVVLFLKKRSTAFLLSLWAIPLLLVYACYYWIPFGNIWLYIRFFLPVFPALILATLAAMTILLPKKTWAQISIAVLALAHGLFWTLPSVRETFAIQRDTVAMAREFASTVNSKLSPGTFLIADPPAHYYLDYATRCKLVETSLFFPGKPIGSRDGPTLTDPALDVPPNPNPQGQSMLYSELKAGRSAALFCRDSHLDVWVEALSPKFKLTPIKQLPFGWTLFQITTNPK